MTVMSAAANDIKNNIVQPRLQSQGTTEEERNRKKWEAQNPELHKKMESERAELERAMERSGPAPKGAQKVKNDIKSFPSAAAKRSYELTHKKAKVIEEQDQQDMFFKDARMFLDMLTVQLKNQNPIKPFDVNQFTEQMAMFSQVEQTMNMSKQMRAMVDNLSQMQTAEGASLIGKDIEINASEDEAKFVEQELNFSYTLPKAVNGTLKARIFNEMGVLVHEEILFSAANGEMINPGEYKFSWKHRKGFKLGKYTLSVEGINTAKNPQTNEIEETNFYANGTVQDKVKAYITSQNGADPMLLTENNRTIPIKQVRRFTAPSALINPNAGQNKPMSMEGEKFIAHKAEIQAKADPAVAEAHAEQNANVTVNIPSPEQEANIEPLVSDQLVASNG